MIIEFKTFFSNFVNEQARNRLAIPKTPAQRIEDKKKFSPYIVPPKPPKKTFEDDDGSD